MSSQCLCKKEAEGDLTIEGDMTTEAEMGVMLPPTKESWRPPEAGRGKERIFPWSLQEEPALLIP